jgi:DNA-binding SARP family transcriptional activator
MITGARLSLLGGFEISIEDERISLPLSAQRLLALLAIEDRVIHRSVAAARLWPDIAPARAAANLRSAVWQCRHVRQFGALDSTGSQLRLRTTDVDFRDLQHRAWTMANGDHSLTHLTDHEDVIARLSRELLPDWSEEWLVTERERWNQVRLHVLESLAQRFMSARKYLSAMEAAFTAVAIDPVRESAHRIVVAIHIAEGNPACAVKHFQRYRGLVQRELGVSPSVQMTRMIHQLASA